MYVDINTIHKSGVAMVIVPGLVVPAKLFIITLSVTCH